MRQNETLWSRNHHEYRLVELGTWKRDRLDIGTRMDRPAVLMLNCTLWRNSACALGRTIAVYRRYAETLS